jgi:hypothetical protein
MKKVPKHITAASTMAALASLSREESDLLASSVTADSFIRRVTIAWIKHLDTDYREFLSDFYPYRPETRHLRRPRKSDDRDTSLGVWHADIQNLCFMERSRECGQGSSDGRL